MALRPSLIRRRLAIVAVVAAVLAVAVGVYWTFVGGSYCTYGEDPAFYPAWSQSRSADGDVTMTLASKAGERLPADRLIVIVDGNRASWADRSRPIGASDTVGPNATLTLTGLDPGDEISVELWDPRPPTPRNRCSSTANFTYDTYTMQ